MPERLVDRLLANRGKVLAAVLVATVGFAAAASRLEFRTSPETILETGDADVASLRSHEAQFGTFEHRLVVVVQAEDVFSPETLARIRDAGARIGALPEVARVRSLARSGFPLPDAAAEPEEFRRAFLANRLLCPFLAAPDGRTAGIMVYLRPSGDSPKTRNASIDAVAAAVRASGLEPWIAGVPAVRRAYADNIRADLYLLPPLVTALLAVLLLLATRRVFPVVGLLAVVAVAAVWTVGVLSLTGGRITALTAILPALIMVVGIATGVHVVAQFREERRTGAGARDAAREAIRKLALPCALTSLTTAVGFSSLVVAGIRDVREFGLYSAVGSLFAFLLGVPLVGIVLSFGGAAGRRPPFLFSRSLRRLALLHDRRPALGAVVGAGLAAVAAIGAVRLESDTFLLEDVRTSTPVYRATKLVDRELGGVIGFDLVVESEGSLTDPARLDWIRHVEDRLAALPGVKAALGPGTVVGEAARASGLEPGAAAGLLLAAIRARGGAEIVDSFLSRDHRTARVLVRTGDVGSARSQEIRREALEIGRSSAPPGVRLRTGGLTVLAETVLSRLIREMGKSLVLAFVVIFALMSLLFRSVRVGAFSMVPNFLPILVAGGFMGFAGIKIRSSIALIFAVALGLAVDDTIHLLTRYRRERAEGRGVRTAVHHALRWTGRPVVLTSVVLFVGFLSFLTSGFKATAQFGLISAVTIVAALVGDLVLLPSLLLLGRGRR